MSKILKILIAMIFVASQNTWAGTTSGDSSTGTAAPSVNQASNTAKSQNSGGQGMSQMAAAMEAAAAAMEAAKCPTSGSACAMAAMFAAMSIMSMMQAKEHGAKADMSAATAADTNALGTTDTLGGTSGDASITGKTADMKKLEAGIGGVTANFDKGTVSVNGKDVPVSAMSSPASMAAAGFSPDQIAAAAAFSDKVGKKVESKYGGLTGANGYEEGGGGGGTGSAGGDTAAAAPAAGLGLGTVNRDPAQVAGMTKNFNGEPIGVAADSIFEMMNRRYKFKDRQNAFLGENDLLLQK